MSLLPTVQWASLIHRYQILIHCKDVQIWMLGGLPWSFHTHRDFLWPFLYKWPSLDYYPDTGSGSTTAYCWLLQSYRLNTFSLHISRIFHLWWQVKQPNLDEDFLCFSAFSSFKDGHSVLDKAIYLLYLRIPTQRLTQRLIPTWLKTVEPSEFLSQFFKYFKFLRFQSSSLQPCSWKTIK